MNTEGLNLDTSGDDRLNSLKLVAKKVAQSTGESFQKLAEKEHDDLNTLDLAQKTAKRIAKSTTDSLRTLEDHHTETATTLHHDTETEPQVVKRDPNDLEKAAERVTKTTSDAAEALASQNSKEGGADTMHLVQQTTEKVATSTGQAMRRLVLNGGPGNYARSHFLNEPSESDHHGFKHTVQQEKDKGLNNPPTSRTPNGKHYLPVPFPASLNSSPLEDERIRRLPSLPPKLNQLDTAFSPKRVLPSVPTTTKTPNDKILTNGFLQNPLLRASDTKRNQSLDSISEYSTTESGEPDMNEVGLSRMPWSLRTKEALAKDQDLNTNPLKRVSHTAEMVAESTGKAVHKLSTTLPNY